jgi:hypothetical protein
MHLPPHRRASRRLIAGLMALCVLFAQSAALAYACKLEAGRLALSATAPCPSHLGDASDAPSDANLCEVHCQTPTLSDADTALLPAILLASRPVVAELSAWRDVAPLPPDPRGAPPPLLLRTSRLLI